MKWFLFPWCMEVEFLRVFPVRTRVVEVGDGLVDLVLEGLRSARLVLVDGDVLALTSKVVSFCEGRVVKLSSVKPSAEGRRLGERYCLEPEFGELVLREADEIYGGVEKAVLTLKHGVLVANAGMDNKNAPTGCVVLWPADPEKTVADVRREVLRLTGKRVGIMIVDSGLIPLRVGTVGLALAVAGFRPIVDERGQVDLFGRRIAITRHAVGDDLACAAHLMMGEAGQRVPAVLIRGAPVEFDEGVYGSKDMMMPLAECLFMGTIAKGKSSVKRSRNRS
jgi:coenzyme F420-0:L-glutamate ligase/coenzyme F420-1:gamma-L-glutamate ligase